MEHRERSKERFWDPGVHGAVMREEHGDRSFWLISLGMISVIALLLPGLVYRMNVEEKLLTEHFGDTYRQYCRAVKRLIRGIW